MVLTLSKHPCYSSHWQECPSLFCSVLPLVPPPNPSIVLPDASLSGLSRVYSGLGPLSASSQLCPLGTLAWLCSLRPQGQAGLKVTSQGLLDAAKPQEPNWPKPAAPHKGAAEKSQVGKVSDFRLNGNEKHWLQSPAKPWAGPRGINGLWGMDCLWESELLRTSGHPAPLHLSLMLLRLLPSDPLPLLPSQLHFP